MRILFSTCRISLVLPFVHGKYLTHILQQLQEPQMMAYNMMYTLVSQKTDFQIIDALALHAYRISKNHLAVIIYGCRNIDMRFTA